MARSRSIKRLRDQHAKLRSLWSQIVEKKRREKINPSLKKPREMSRRKAAHVPNQQQVAQIPQQQQAVPTLQQQPSGNSEGHSATYYGVKDPEKKITDMVTEEGEEKETFENEQNSRPAKAHVRQYRLRWKDGRIGNAEVVDKLDNATLNTATHILETWNTLHYLDGVLTADENRKIAAFFTSGSSSAADGSLQTVANLIESAVGKSIRKYIHNPDQLNYVVSDEDRRFLHKRARAKNILVELLLKNTKLLPESWNCTTVTHTTSDEQEKQNESQSASSSQPASSCYVDNYGMMVAKNYITVKNPPKKGARSVTDHARRVVKKKRKPPTERREATAVEEKIEKKVEPSIIVKAVEVQGTQVVESTQEQIEDPTEISARSDDPEELTQEYAGEVGENN